MDWKYLKDALGRMPPAGVRGFEGLIAGILGAETGYRYYVARNGDQPSGDAYAPDMGVALQTKRMTASSIRENELEGDIDRVIREIPALEIYVIATTRPISAQLRLRIQSKIQEIAIDIILLDYGDAVSELGALCVQYSAITRAFLPDLPAEWESWAKATAQTAEVSTALANVRNALRNIQTRKNLISEAKEAFKKRFDCLAHYSHNPVRLSSAIERTSIKRMLHEWWAAGDGGVAVIEGEEGVGKTWVAAAYGNELLHEQDVVVLWLDSIQWTGVTTIEGLIEIALTATLPPGNDAALDRLKRKALGRWAVPSLIILDGVNERGAWNAAEQLLHTYRLHADQLKPHIRLLFTSRELDRRLSVGTNFWRGIKVIPIGEFSDEEFREALALEGISESDFNVPVRKLAMIPRYLTLCIQLRGRLASVRQLSKELLLWMDLESKLERRDPQWLNLTQTLGGNPRAILAHLAGQLGWPSSPSIPKSELQRLLPSFDQVRDDLIEQRIILSAEISTVTLNREHLMLGWALLLHQEARIATDETPDSVCERLYRLLEPAASNDDKVQAVQLATILAFLTDSDSVYTRVSLLLLWAQHHNAYISSDNLEFFAVSDIAAYTLTIEKLFRNYLGGQFEAALIEALAVLWRDRNGIFPELQDKLERWLRLIFPGDASGSSDGTVAPPPRFPAAETAEQLRLSLAAISIISFAPKVELLSALADCFRSNSFCYLPHEAGETSVRFPVKNPIDALGLLIRWHYGENALLKVADLAESMHSNSTELTELHDFSCLWRTNGLPKILGTPEDIDSRIREPHITELFREWLLDRFDTHRQIVGLGQLQRFAVRRDLPSLSDREVEPLITKLREYVDLFMKGGESANEWTFRVIQDLLPWVARYSPNDFCIEVAKLWRAALSSEYVAGMLMSLDEMIPGGDPEGNLVETILHWGESVSLLENGEALSACPLTVVVLLHGNAQQLEQWLAAFHKFHVSIRESSIVQILPLPTAFAGLAPIDLVDRAKRRADLAIAELEKDASDSAALNRARHWLHIYSYLVTSSRDVVIEALQLANWISDEKLRFSLFSIVSQSSERDLAIHAMSHPAFAKFQTGVPSRYLWTKWFNQEALSIDDLAGITSISVAGQLLLRGKQDDELRKWGFLVAELAYAKLENMDDGSKLPVEIHREISSDGLFEGFSGRPLTSRSFGWYGPSSGVWGIDRSADGSLDGPTDEQLICAEVAAQVEAWRSSGLAEISEFNAAGPLKRWAELETEHFTAFAEDFLLRMANADFQKRAAFGGLVSSIFGALLHVAPEKAFKIEECLDQAREAPPKLFDQTRTWRTYSLWNATLNKSTDIEMARRESLLNAPNDEVILGYATVAWACDNIASLSAMAQEFVQSAAARERALGVTLLAYIGDTHSLSSLQNLHQSDLSFWIREHAGWAAEICAAELACRERYAQIIAMTSLENVSAGLAEICGALSPMALAWHWTIEKNAAPQCDNRRLRTYLEIFWYNWGKTSARSREIKLGGRELWNFCRGERLQEGVSSRMAPWWQIG